MVSRNNFESKLHALNPELQLWKNRLRIYTRTHTHTHTIYQLGQFVFKNRDELQFFSGNNGHQEGSERNRKKSRS